MYEKLFDVEFLSMWSIMIFIGLIAAVLIYRFLSVPLKITNDAFFSFGIILIISVAAGFVFAYLFQALYEIIKKGEATSGGVTFSGGLVGGVAVFFIICLIRLKGDKRKQIWSITCIAPVAITAAHAFGRIGCFLGGCCFGKETDSWIGITFPDGSQPANILNNTHAVTVIPTQIIEALFLFILCGVLLLIILKYRRYGLSMIIYLFAYSIFRFIIEFYRGDASRAVNGALSPSQWQSVFMFLCAAALTIYMFVFKRIPFNGKQQGDLTKFVYEKSKEMKE